MAFVLIRCIKSGVSVLRQATDRTSEVCAGENRSSGRPEATCYGDRGSEVDRAAGLYAIGAQRCGT